MFKFLIVFLIFIISPLSFSQNYRRGNHECSSSEFEEARIWYNYEPENHNTQTAYAACRILKGEDARGLLMLSNMADRYNDISAAYTPVKYIGSGGAFFDNDIYEDSTEEQLIAGLQAWTFFSLSLDNDEGHEEKERRIELHGYYYATLMSGVDFRIGATGHHNIFLLLSPSYNGDRNLKTYPGYALYTMDNLREMIHHADSCLASPYNFRFKPDLYRKINQACQVLKDEAEALLPLEERRLFLLGQECIDLLKCPEHDRISNEIIAVIKASSSERERIFSSQ